MANLRKIDLPSNGNPAPAVVKSLLAGGTPDGVRPEEYGPDAEMIADLCDAHRAGGTAEVRKRWEGWVKMQPHLAQLVAGDPPPKKRYQTFRLSDAMKPKQPERQIVAGIFPEGSLSQVFGDPGTKKTYILLDAAVAVAMGEPWLGRETSQGPALIVDEESGRRRLERRIEGVARARHAPHDTPFFYVSLTQFDLREEDDVRSLRELIEETGAVFVVIDAMADVMPGADENSVKDVQPVLMALRKVAEETRAAIVLIHHSNKAGGYRGSSAIMGALDLQLKVESKPDSPNIDLSSEKTRDVEPFAMAAHIRFEEDPVRVYVSPADTKPSQKREQFNAGEEYVLRHLQEHGPSTVKDIQDRADTVPSRTAKNAVYSLAQRNKIHRVDDGGRGTAAVYDLLKMITGPTPEDYGIPYKDS